MDDTMAAMAAAVRDMHASSDVQETLDAIVRSASISIPGFEHVGITTTLGGGREHTRAASTDLTLELDHLQYELDEGPCLSAIEGPTVTMVPDARHEQRWPRFMKEAVKRGLRSQMGIKLHLDSRGTLGGLNLYSTERDDIDPDAEPMAELFAAQAAVALGSAHEIDGLNQALGSRQLIGQAVGILMERFDLDEGAAFAFLTRASSHGNIKLRDVARQVVDERGHGRVPPKG